MYNDITIGSWITINNESVVEVLSETGFDWLCIDMEHSSIDFNDTQKLILTIQSKNLKAFVRVGKNDSLLIKRVLDSGADGLIVPMVNSKHDVDNIINSSFYPPIGKRGVGLARAQGYGFNFETYKNQKQKEIKIIVQIEHVDAIKNLDEILDNKYIYGSIIGPYDLSGSMGKPGNYDDNDILELLKKYESTAKKFKKKIGFHVIKPDHNLVYEKIKDGYDFIAFSLDTIFLGQMPRNELEKLKIKLK